MSGDVKYADMFWKEELSELEQAIADGDIEYVKMAVSTGDDPNGSEEESLLFIAIVERQREIAQFLMEAGADPNLLKPSGWGCLLEVVASNDLEWVELLARHGARVGAKIPQDERTELHMAARNGLLEMAQLLTEEAGGRHSLERFDELDQTPLIAASQSGHLEVARYLLDAGADVNALIQMTRRDKVGDTAISCAAYTGHVAVVELLLSRGADPYRPGWMWTNAWDQFTDKEGTEFVEMERALHIPELKRPAQTPHRQELETQLLDDLKFHGCHCACNFDCKGTKPVGETITVQGKPVRAFSNLRALDENGLVVAEGDVDFLVLTREIEVRAFWSKLNLAGRSPDLPRGVPSHILALLSEHQKYWIVMDRRNYCGRLKREDLDLIR